MDDSPLRKLPPELRLNVYEFALTEYEPVTVTFDHTANEEGDETVKVTYGASYALQETCKEIRKECSLIFFKKNTFLLHLKDIPRDGVDIPDLDPNQGLESNREALECTGWRTRVAPITHFHRITQSMGLSNVCVHIDLGTFSQPQHCVFWLAMITTTQTLDRETSCFGGELSIKISFLITKQSGDSEEIPCSIDCLNPVPSLLALSQAFSELTLKNPSTYLPLGCLTVLFSRLADLIDENLQRNQRNDIQEAND